MLTPISSSFLVLINSLCVISSISALQQFPTRIIGCSGFPADSHDNVYLHLTRDLKNHRCPECGNGELLLWGLADNAPRPSIL